MTDIYYAAPSRPSALTSWLDVAVADMLTFYPLRHVMGLPAKPVKGDKVTVTTTGYVEHVYGDGSFDLVDRRSAFGDDAVDIGHHYPDDHTTVRVVEKAPPAPKVGDVIDSDTWRATPWRRGTIVTTVSERDEPYTSYVLTADGDWLALAERGGRYPFSMFGSACRLRIDSAPGK